MKTIITLIAASILATGCASTGTTQRAPMSAADYCKSQAQMVASRMAVRNMDASPLSGRAHPQDVKDYVFNDCMDKVAVK